MINSAYTFLQPFLRGDEPQCHIKYLETHTLNEVATDCAESYFRLMWLALENDEYDYLPLPFNKPYFGCAEQYKFNPEYKEWVETTSQLISIVHDWTLDIIANLPNNSELLKHVCRVDNDRKRLADVKKALDLCAFLEIKNVIELGGAHNYYYRQMLQITKHSKFYRNYILAAPYLMELYYSL